MKTYQTTRIDYDCGKWGVVPFKHWEHPFNEPMRKFMTEDWLNVVSRYVVPGDVCVDIGGYSGDTPVSMAVVAGKSGKVLAFEPNPSAFNVLLENSKLHPTITPIPLAILTEPAFATFHYTDDGLCNGGFITKTEAGIGTVNLTVPFEVFGLPLQSLVEKANVIKIDTEGYDRFIIESIMGLIETCRPKMIVECFKGLNIDERRKLFATIPKWYSCVDFFRGVPIDEKYYTEHDHFDFVCLPA